ncbi:MAG: AAA family ATPase [Sphaerochaeta sp.]
MRFCTITTNQFRNLKEEPLEVDASKVLLIGPNGQGKTNLLEALYTLCYGSSFRTSPDQGSWPRMASRSFASKGRTGMNERSPCTR